VTYHHAKKSPNDEKEVAFFSVSADRRNRNCGHTSTTTHAVLTAVMPILLSAMTPLTPYV